CHSLCAQLPVASRSGLRLEIADPAQPLYAAAARRTLELALEDPALVAAAQLLFRRLDNDWSKFESLLELMLEGRAHWLPRLLASDGKGDVGGAALEALVGASLRSLIEGRLAAVVAVIPRELLEQGAALAAHAASTRHAQGDEVD